jgi:elongation factor Ts
MSHDINIIQQLRDMTGAGVMECKKALDEAGGDLKKAAEIVVAKGAAKMEGRSDRTTGAGQIFSYVHSKRIGVLMDLRAETDFVVKTEDFQNLGHELVMQLAAVPAANVEEFLAQPYIKNDSKTVKDMIMEISARTGEVIRVNSISRLEV